MNYINHHLIDKKTSKDIKKIGDYLGVSYKHIERTYKGVGNIITYKRQTDKGPTFKYFTKPHRKDL